MANSDANSTIYGIPELTVRISENSLNSVDGDVEFTMGVNLKSTNGDVNSTKCDDNSTQRNVFGDVNSTKCDDNSTQRKEDGDSTQRKEDGDVNSTRCDDNSTQVRTSDVNSTGYNNNSTHNIIGDANTTSEKKMCDDIMNFRDSNNPVLCGVNVFRCSCGARANSVKALFNHKANSGCFGDTKCYCGAVVYDCKIHNQECRFLQKYKCSFCKGWLS